MLSQNDQWFLTQNEHHMLVNRLSLLVVIFKLGGLPRSIYLPKLTYLLATSLVK
jgi:hypothetical protein